MQSPPCVFPPLSSWDSPEQWSRAWRRACLCHGHKPAGHHDVKPWSSGAWDCCAAAALCRTCRMCLPPCAHPMLSDRLQQLLGAWLLGRSQAEGSSSHGQTRRTEDTAGNIPSQGEQVSPGCSSWDTARKYVVALEESQECRTRRGHEVARQFQPSLSVTAGRFPARTRQASQNSSAEAGGHLQWGERRGCRAQGQHPGLCLSAWLRP